MFYWHVNSADELVLSRHFFTMFEYTKSKRIIDIHTGKCVKALGSVNRAPIVLSCSCSDETSQWRSSKGSLMNPSSKKCLHPVGGGIEEIKEENHFVLHGGCGMDRVSLDILSELSFIS